MKRTSLVVGLLIIITNGYSQTLQGNNNISTTFIGFQIGLTSCEMTGEQINLELDNSGASFVRQNGLEIAFRVKHEFNNLFYFKSGVGFYQKNGHVEGSRVIYPTHGPYNFLQIPILIGIQPINLESSAFKLGLESGFSLNSLISTADDVTMGTYGDFDTKSIVPSFHLGVNLEIPINNKTSFNANYQYSKDLTYYYNRRLTYTHMGEEKFKDYDLWFKSYSISIGFIFKLNNEQ
ncbi:hypothetical protein SAMN04488029_0768 [Reichenbachiella faecimaris]|uniref:Outer membrane protein beta-barrel domain-containing protein n=1 Tax=Reichenbachiella faecimaris TaxID=692418 RepID=A0A1W2G727_REIFA|nr:hypothetical protein [Reichenbachiella faecimaris]SMD32423.1 hypothetical protein SAMN04488029_0768 [Reichenbachiella faecimaris]